MEGWPPWSQGGLPRCLCLPLTSPRRCPPLPLSLAAVKSRQRLEARAAVEEDMMSRVPLSKDEAKRLKQQRREGMSGGWGAAARGGERGCLGGGGR